MNSGTSRTGLVPTARKAKRISHGEPECRGQLPKKLETTPMALSLRPLGGLFNPFAKGCSVLCNHPAPAEVKEVINRYKQTLAIEGRNVQGLQQSTPAEQGISSPDDRAADNIPEDLFRRYTDTDSRPLTPTPTVTSTHTRTSAGSFLNNRRCITPELGKNDIFKRKKIILDLRKSHSQETLFWKPSSDLSSGLTDQEVKSHSAGANEDKKTRRQKSEEQRPKSSLAATAIAEEEHSDDGVKQGQFTACINDEDYGDDDIRRGKRRKRIKAATTTATSFHLSQDPETQVAALGPDSLNPSNRPSLILNSINLLASGEKTKDEQILLKDSYLTEEAFATLKIKVDVDAIEDTFERYLNRAYREVYKYLPVKSKDYTEDIKEIDKYNSICPKMPRKLSKASSRFGVPLNLRSLEALSVWDYLGQFVWVSRQRKKMYKRIFLKYIKIPTESRQQRGQPKKTLHDERLPLAKYTARCMNTKFVYQALEEALEFYGTDSNISRVLYLLDYEEWNEANKLTFRIWCGITAFAERSALTDETDSCEELEKADFNSMELRIEKYTISEKLRQVFDIIIKTHKP